MLKDNSVISTPFTLSQYFCLPLFSRGMWLVSVSIQRYALMFSKQVILQCKLWISLNIITSLFDWAFQMWVYMYLLSRLALIVWAVLKERWFKEAACNRYTVITVVCTIFTNNSQNYRTEKDLQTNISFAFFLAVMAQSMSQYRDLTYTNKHVGLVMSA